MVQLTLKLKITPGSASAVIHALQAVMLGAQWHRGWMRAQAYRGLGDSGALYYLEEWPSSEDAAREIRSARFSRLLELMEAAAEPPDLQFQFITEVRGLDYVAQVRGDQHPGTT